MTKKTYFTVLVLIIILLIGAFLLRIDAITNPSYAIFLAIKNPYLAFVSVFLAFVLNKNKYYWLWIIAGAFFFVLTWQTLVLGVGLSMGSIIYKMIAFLFYAFMVKLLRFII